MRNLSKKLLSLLLTMALLGALPVLADGEEIPAPDDLFQLGSVSESGHLSFAEDVEAAPEEAVSVRSARSAEAPAADGAASTRYDPRDSGFLTPVRSQGSWNTCWVVAAMGAAEIGGLKRGLLTTDVSQTNLSERHLVYFLSHPADDPLGNSSLDYNTNPSYWITAGGNPILATMTLANWHGAASEAATNSPYSGLSGSDSLSAAYAYTDVLHLENTYAMNVSTAAQRSALKSMILQYGGAVLCFYYNASYLFAGSPSAQAEPEPTETPSRIILRNFMEPKGRQASSPSTGTQEQ